MRRRSEEVVPTVGLPMPWVLERARPTSTRDHPFFTVIPTHRPIWSPFTTRRGYGGRILDLNPSVLTGLTVFNKAFYYYYYYYIP